jgi:hypothetical protein
MTAQTIFHVLVFFLGFFAWIVVSLKNRFEKNDLISASVALFFALIFSILFPHTGIVGYFVTVFAVFCVGLLLLLRKKFASLITEYSIIVWTAIFWYAYFGLDSRLTLVTLFLFVPSVFILMNTYFHLDRKYLVRVLLYCWFLFTALSIAIFSSSHYFSGAIESSSLLLTFGTGFSFAYIVLNLSFLFSLLPIPNKHETLEQTKNDAYKTIRFLGTRFVWMKGNVHYASGLLAFLVIIFWSNAQYHFISDSALISGCLFLAVLNESLLSRTAFRADKGGSDVTPEIDLDTKRKNSDIFIVAFFVAILVCGLTFFVYSQ